MNEEKFWRLIETSRPNGENDVERHIAALTSALERMSVDDIFEFEDLFGRYLREAYDGRLWAAGSILDDLSDDGFWDFRAWLILQGRDAYMSVLRDPEELASMMRLGDRVTAEEMSGVAQNAYRSKTGRDDFVAVYRFQAERLELKNASLDWKTVGGWADSEKLRKLYPKLWEKRWRSKIK